MSGGLVLNPERRDFLLAEASRIGEEIWKRRSVVKGGALTWYRPPSDSCKEAGERIRIDPFLYDGAAGIAFFFAALETLHRDGRNRQRCLETLQALRGRLAALTADPERSRNPAIGLGGVIGLGSLLYVLSQVACLLEDDDLLAEARQLLPLFSLDRIERDVQLDLLYGAAGTILALLAFDRVTASASGSALPLELARLCADHLLRNQEADEQAGARAWTTLAGVARLGNLNHGASGICHALLELYRKTGEADLLASAREGLAYESRLFDSNRGGWRDLRFPGQEFFELSWCSGSPGMAVARLAAHDLLGDSGIQEQAEIAVAALCKAALLETDHLCCGNCGVVEALLSAAMIQGNEALAAAAYKRILEMIDRSRIRGTFSFRRAWSPSAFDPGFFTGAAGLGYTFLRLTLREYWKRFERREEDSTDRLTTLERLLPEGPEAKLREILRGGEAVAQMEVRADDPEWSGPGLPIRPADVA